MTLFESTNEGLGLDIGTSSIKVVWLKKTRSLIRLMGYNSLSIDSNTFNKNSIVKKNDLVSAINKLLKDSKLRPIRYKKVNCALPEIMTFIKTLNLPQMPEEELGNAISWEIKQFVPLPITKLFWDWQVVSKIKDRQEIFLAVAPQKLVNDFYEVIQKSGLEMNTLEVEPVVISRALIKPTMLKKCILIADIGSQTTNFSIYDNNSIRFTHNTMIGGRAQTEILAKAFHLDLMKTENLKLTLNKDSKLNNNIKKALAPSIKDLTSEIKRSINFYEEKFNKKVDIILLCGGGANLIDVDKYIFNTLGIETEIGNPWINVTTYPLKNVPHEEVPLYTQAIGSALRDIKN